MTPICFLDALDAERDLPALTRLYADPSVRAFLGGPLGAASARSRAAELLQPDPRWPIWAIRHQDGETLLGMISFDDHHDGDAVEVSYLLLPEHQGQGFATLALKAALAYGFGPLGLARIVAETQTANVASRRLLERVGMKPERCLLRFGAEQSLYAVTRSAFSALA